MQVPLFETQWEESDLKAAENVIKRGTYWATGPEIKEFEKELAHYFGRKYCVVFSSGTTALHAVLLAYQIKPGDEVIVPALTFISTANSVLFVGATPVFGDIEKDTYCLDADDIERKLTDKTKVIMPVHYGGCPARDIEKIASLAREKNILLLEDAAAAHGARINNKLAGTFGDAAMISFCQSKIISSGGEGGAIITDDIDLYEKLKLLVSHGRADNKEYYSREDLFDYIHLGYNFRMPTICAAIGLSQLKRIDKLIGMRKEVASMYTKELQNISGVKPWIPPDNLYSVNWIYAMEVLDGKRAMLQKYLSEHGVSAKFYYNLIHKTKFYRDVLKIKADIPVTDECGSKLLSLPMSPVMTIEQINYVIETVKGFFSKHEI